MVRSGRSLNVGTLSPAAAFLTKDIMKPILLRFPFYNVLTKTLIFAHYSILAIGLTTIGVAGYSWRYGLPEPLRYVNLAYLQLEVNGTQRQIESEIERRKAFQEDVQAQLKEMQEAQVKLAQKRK